MHDGSPELFQLPQTVVKHLSELCIHCLRTRRRAGAQRRRRTSTSSLANSALRWNLKRFFLFSVFCLARDLKPFDPLYELHFGLPVWWMTRFKTATEFSCLSLCASLTAQTSPLLSFQENRPPQLEVLEVSNIQFLLNPKGGKLQSVQ